MKTLMRKKAMECVIEQTAGASKSRGDTNKDTKACHLHTNILAINPMLCDDKKVIRCVLLDSGRCGVVWKNGNVKCFLSLVISEEMHACTFGPNHHIWHRDLGQADKTTHEHSIVKAGLLLPFQQHKLDDDDAGCVSNCCALAATSKDHQTLDCCGKLDFAQRLLLNYFVEVTDSRLPTDNPSMSTNEKAQPLSDCLAIAARGGPCLGGASFLHPARSTTTDARPWSAT
jgi:hypothetical protein